jgi:hypothetical protein
MRRFAEETAVDGREDHLTGLYLWVPKTCVTWADALQIVVGAIRVRTSGGRVLVRPEVG